MKEVSGSQRHNSGHCINAMDIPYPAKVQEYSNTRKEGFQYTMGLTLQWLLQSPCPCPRPQAQRSAGLKYGCQSEILECPVDLSV